MQRCFGPFSGGVGRAGNYDRVERETRDLCLTLQEKLDRRRRDLALGLPLSVRSVWQFTLTVICKELYMKVVGWSFTLQYTCLIYSIMFNVGVIRFNCIVSLLH